MNCHSMLEKQTVDIQKLQEAAQERRPISWVKVHNVPDFVYFNHSQHVLAAVDCAECHGAVEQMAEVRQEATLTMGWCLDCHERRRVGAVAVEAAARAPQDHAPLGGLDCGRCHY
jgi:hypothetical protein